MNYLLKRFAVADEEYRLALRACQERGAEMLCAVREQYDLTLEEAAVALECDKSYLSKIENGHIAVSRPLLLRLYAFLREREEQNG